VLNRDSFRLIDFMEFLFKRKRHFILIFFLSLLLSYAGIYLFIEEKFDATAMIVPQEDNTTTLGGSLMRNMKAISLSGGKTSSNPQIDLYKTIISSRSMLEDIIERFHLISVYKLDTNDIERTEEALKILRSQIVAGETDEEAFMITARSNNRQRSADMANYIVAKLNTRIVELQIAQARDKRIFLANRIAEITAQLRAAEDSLKVYQEKTGLLDVKSQLPEVLKAYSLFETELTSKQIQKNIYERLYGEKSSQVEEVGIQIAEYEKKLNELQSTSNPGSAILPLKKIPQTSTEFLRRYRDVLINNMVLEYIVPLYEQSKIEEEKNYPVIGIIDYAVPPVRKSFPPRVLSALICAFSLTVIIIFYQLMQEIFWKDVDPRWKVLVGELKHWSQKK